MFGLLHLQECLVCCSTGIASNMQSESQRSVNCLRDALKLKLSGQRDFQSESLFALRPFTLQTESLFALLPQDVPCVTDKHTYSTSVNC